jgi:hypothetical protein
MYPLYDQIGRMLSQIAHAPGQRRHLQCIDSLAIDHYLNSAGPAAADCGGLLARRAMVACSVTAVAGWVAVNEGKNRARLLLRGIMIRVHVGVQTQAITHAFARMHMRTHALTHTST